MQAQQQQLINGVWMDGAAESLNKYDPVSGELLWQGGRPAVLRSRVR